MRFVATWPITAPKTSRMIRVSPADAAASRQRTGQLRGLSRRPRCLGSLTGRATCSSILDHVAGAAFRVEQPRLAAGLELAAQVGDEDVDRVGRRSRVIAPDLVEKPLPGD